MRINVSHILILKGIENDFNELGNASDKILRILFIRFEFLYIYLSPQNDPEEKREIIETLTLIVSMICTPIRPAVWSPGIFRSLLPRFDASWKITFALSSAGDCQSLVGLLLEVLLEDLDRNFDEICWNIVGRFDIDILQQKGEMADGVEGGLRGDYPLVRVHLAM